jgi:sugar phosphate isomerase/epimerase
VDGWRLVTGPAPARLLSLSAGTVLDAAPEAALDAAAAAGFGGFGIRWDPARLPPSRLPALRQRIGSSGLALLDLEVVRLRPDVPVTAHRAWAETAAELGARFLLAVSHHESPDRTVEELCTLADWCSPSGVTVALEFMRFTAVPSFRSASELLRRAARPGLTVLVDALHLQRGGETAADLTAADAGPVGYVQVCDAPRAAPGAPGDLGALADEARHGRLFPGAGELPLTDLLGVLPADLPCCVEVQSDAWSGVDVGERARYAMASTRALLTATADRARPTPGNPAR